MSNGWVCAYCCGAMISQDHICPKCFPPKIKEEINHPLHYQAKNDPDGVYEVIKVIEAWNLNLNIGNTVKYLARAGKKDPNVLRDLKKSLWYLTREIQNLEKVNGDSEKTTNESKVKEC